MKKIRIEEVGDITSKYRYLEVFYLATNEMFLRIKITEDKKLAFNFFPSGDEILLELDEMSFIMNTA